jgi:S-DNA-T family DNA segregation ATPase FtsK/SpoIIIE
MAGHRLEQQAMRGVVGLVDDPLRARQLPLIVDLARGHAVLFGASGYGKTTFLRTLSPAWPPRTRPTEFQAHILDLGGRSLEVLKALPHVGSIIMPDERGYEERVEQLLRELDNVWRSASASSLASAASPPCSSTTAGDPPQLEPAILVAIDNFSDLYRNLWRQGWRR